VELVSTGALRNRRSEHRYRDGLHRLDLTWDELEYPTGAGADPPRGRGRLPAGRAAARAGVELSAVLGEMLVKSPRSKTREFCERLYPDLLAA
jgi:hypothetical protein